MEKVSKNIMALDDKGGVLGYFNPDDILNYGSLENLTNSDLLKGIDGREKYLKQIWEAANPEIEDIPE